MKKMIMAALVLAAGVFGVNAQGFSPRVEVGAAFSNMSFNNFSGDTKIGLRAGAALEIGLSDQGMVNVYLAPGVTYKMGGYKNPATKAIGNVVDVLAGAGLVDKDQLKGLSADVTTHNISIPVNFGMRAHFADAFAASVEVGPYFSYALSGKVGAADMFMVENNGNKRFDAGLGVSAALEYSKFYLRLGTEFGFLNQHESQAAKDGKNKSFYTTLGFRF